MKSHAITAPRRGYETPWVTTYGTLRELTSSEAMFGMSPLAQSGLGLSPVMMPGEPPNGGGPEVLGDPVPEAGPAGPAGPPGAEVLGDPIPTDGPPGDGGAPGGDGPPDAEAGAAAPLEDGGSEGELPFSGFAAATVTAVGGALTAAGVALRRVTRRH